MTRRKITSAGQISLPAIVRARWNVSSVAVDDLGDHVVVRPLPDDPIKAARGALRNRTIDSKALREAARRDEATAEQRR
jgi:bifunctional DNA-binding transcriptional regulator/antitoxin component of YhaV-PrlF toxin-antitoxin module